MKIVVFNVVGVLLLSQILISSSDLNAQELPPIPKMDCVTYTDPPGFINKCGEPVSIDFCYVATFANGWRYDSCTNARPGRLLVSEVPADLDNPTSLIIGQNLLILKDNEGDLLELFSPRYGHSYERFIWTACPVCKNGFSSAVVAEHNGKVPTKFRCTCSVFSPPSGDEQHYLRAYGEQHLWSHP